jgi:hypothetical protein
VKQICVNPRGCGSPGLTGCGWCRCLVEVWNWVHVDVSSGTRMASARGSATPQAIIRCGEPVQLQFLKGCFACNRAEEPVVGQGHGRFANCAMMQ